MIAKPEEIVRFKEQLLHPIPPSKAKRVIECLFTFDLPVKGSEIWPYLIDTSKMNFEMGFPPREEREVNGETHVSTVTLKKKEEWIEKPWIWVQEKEIQQHRVFLRGWMASHRGVFRIEELSNDSTRVYVYFRWGFHSFFNHLFFKMVSPALEKTFNKFFQDKAKVILEERKDKTKTGLKRLAKTDAYDAIRSYFLTADPLDLDRIHVKEIAGKFGIELQDAIRACIRMVKDNELSLSWDVICPHCRGARSETKSISGLVGTGSCEPCGTIFPTDQEESVEVVFHITSKLRMIPKVVYCAAEPAKKKHIKLFQSIGPGVSKTFHMSLPPGTYRLRKKNTPDAKYIELSDHEKENKLYWDGTDFSKKKISTHFELSVTNLSAEKDFFTLEEAWWFNDRLLSGEALSNPLIREIFSEDHLQTGLKLNVGNQVILFTDIVGSTPFYKSAGDAVALKLVQSHYQEVSELIVKHEGVIVKYIGDAIMAAFS